MNKIGRVGKETAKAVAKWKKSQKPNHEGYFICYMCKKWVPYLQAEHVKGRARHPGKRTAMDNLMATCSDCNAKKGSKEYEEVL
jgi:5-methylcytosine-specific restriction endonuclease McrA